VEPANGASGKAAHTIRAKRIAYSSAHSFGAGLICPSQRPLIEKTFGSRVSDLAAAIEGPENGIGLFAFRTCGPRATPAASTRVYR
jgi:hypothetical protein